MKKMKMCLLVGALLLAVAACGRQGEEETATVQEAAPEYKELTDPRGNVPESTATGESKPQLVETMYETNDVVIADYIPTEMGYAVDATGQSDSTVGIQEALYDCYHAGGGTVYLPAGNYAISDTIYIPPYVTLRGDWQDPDEGTEYGTIISVWMEPEDYEGAGAFEISGCAGAVGLTVYYPMQTMDCIMPYPYTFYFEETQETYYMLATVKNVTIINGYRGIGTSSTIKHEQLQVDNVKGTFLHCAFQAANSSDVGTVQNLVVNNKYWKEASADCMNAAQGSVLDAYTKQYVTGMTMGDLEWTTFNNISIDKCAVGIHLVKGVRIDFAGSLYDVNITDCEKGLLVDGLDSRWGLIMSRSHIEGGIINNTSGKVKLCDVEVEGDIVEYEEGSVIMDAETDLSVYEIDYSKSYVKPNAKVWVADIPSGLSTDATAALQKLLDQAAKEGGVVYLPGDIYCFSGPITVPAGVELRGSSSVPTRESDAVCCGTRFYCYYGDDEKNGADDQAFITLAGENAGVNGIRILYPENSTKNGDFNSTYTIRGEAAGVYVVNSMIVASAYGIDFRNCDEHLIDGVMATCYYNTFNLGGENGVLRRCLQNATVMQRTKAPGLVNWITGGELYEWVFDKVVRKEGDYILVEDATNQLIYNTFSYGSKTSVTSKNSENTRVINLGNDYLGAGNPQITLDGGDMTCINVMRYNGYSYELVQGDIKLYNRIAISAAGERTLEKSK